jgi:hypothetical protein
MHMTHHSSLVTPPSSDVFQAFLKQQIPQSSMRTQELTLICRIEAVGRPEDDSLFLHVHMVYHFSIRSKCIALMAQPAEAALSNPDSHRVCQIQNFLAINWQP